MYTGIFYSMTKQVFHIITSVLNDLNDEDVIIICEWSVFISELLSLPGPLC